MSKVAVRRRQPAPGSDAPAWRPPTANSFDWQRVRVGHREEQTCTACGETTTTGYCIRCGRVTKIGDIIAGDSQLVPTLSYLNAGEYQES